MGLRLRARMLYWAFAAERVVAGQRGSIWSAAGLAVRRTTAATNACTATLPRKLQGTEYGERQAAFERGGRNSMSSAHMKRWG